MQQKNFPPSLNWSYDELLAMVPGFLEINSNRPIGVNEGGMKAPHMFALYCFLKKLSPRVVIESGVWKGQGTWLIEQTLPTAQLYCIDLDLSTRQYISKNANYLDKDFASIDWSHLTDKRDVLLFFDDHQSALKRIRVGKDIGFKNFIFEDNYPAGQGDCYSLKKAFLHAGHGNRPHGLKSTIKSLIGKTDDNYIAPNSSDAGYLNQVLSVYYEFPPVYKSDTTRWGDAWTDDKYPTPKPILNSITDPNLNVFREEVTAYTWMCLAQLK